LSPRFALEGTLGVLHECENKVAWFAGLTIEAQRTHHCARRVSHRQDGVLGCGNVGGTLGTRWRQRGHEVLFGLRNPSDPKAQNLAKELNAKIGTAADASAFGDVVVLAVPWAVAEDVIKSAGNLSGKILLDCTNPVTEWPEIEIGAEFSGGQRVAQWATGASVVKIFNTTGCSNMSNPKYRSEAVTIFYAGDDASAKRAAEQLAADLGFDPLDAGPLSNSKYLEMLAGFWGTLAFGQKLGLEIGFRLLRR
jgi:8-hydroxy-5-deazaflavin:NADPH oxidoreductase